MQLHLAQELALVDVRSQVTAEDLRTALTAFFSHLRTCTACDGTGTIEVRPQYSLKATRSPYDRSHPEDMFPVGGKMPCPRCATDGDGSAQHGDPEFVKWVCVSDTDYHACNGTSGEKKGHESCGRRLVLPLDFMHSDADPAL